MSYTAWSLVYGEQPSTAKWNILGTNDAHFYDFLGDYLQWQSWTPTLSGGATKGNGTVSGSYITIGKMVYARFLYILGTTSTWTGAMPLIDLPVDADTSVTPNGHVIGHLMLEDVSGASNLGYALLSSTDAFEPIAIGAGATYATVQRITTTVPFSWASTDYIAGTLRYFK